MKFSKTIQVGESKMDVNISVLNPRTLTISPANGDYEILNSKEELVGLNYCDNLIIKEGSTLLVGKQKYKIQKIKRNSCKGLTNSYKLYTHLKLSKSCNFIMPFLGFTRAYFRWSYNFVNCFIGTEEMGDYGDSIYLLYRFSGHISFSEFESKLQKHPWYVETIDTDRFHVMYKFDIPEKEKKQVRYILKGKYSKLSEKSKERLLTFHATTIDTVLGQILTKDQSRRVMLEESLASSPEYKDRVSIDQDAELYDVFYTEEEIFMNSYIIKDRDSISNKFEETKQKGNEL